MENRCLYLKKAREFLFAEESIPIPLDNQVLIKIAYNGICGSDVHFYLDGKLGNFIVDRPYIPGHEASGIVEAVGNKVTRIHVGDYVVPEPGIACGKCKACRKGTYNLCKDVVFLSAPPINGTFCDYIVIEESFVHLIPKGLSLEHAALAEPTAVAVHAINRAQVHPGEDGVIVGAGPIGLLTLQAFKAAGGGKITVIDQMEERLKKAIQLHADAVIHPAKQDWPKNIGDVVFETAGSNMTTQMLFSLARPGGKCVQVGWPKDNQVPLDVAMLMEKEITYLGLNRYANTFETALKWLKDGRIQADEMITQRFSFDRAPQAFDWMISHPEGTLKVIVANQRDKRVQCYRSECNVALSEMMLIKNDRADSDDKQNKWKLGTRLP